jgi:hypothetical protein
VVEWAGQRDEVSFVKNDKGRTVVGVVRNGAELIKI